MQKARSHHTQWLLPLVSVWFQVLFHSAVRGSFHLSFTVLVRYRSLKCIQPCQMVLADSHKISRVSRYSGYCQCTNFYVYGTITHYGSYFHLIPLEFAHTLQSYNPNFAETKLVWAVPFSLATTKGITELFYFPPGTQMFQFSGLASFRIIDLQSIGLPHSDIIGSRDISSSPMLIAGNHVLLRH